MHPLLVLCGLLFSLHTPSCSAATDTLPRGHALAADERLVSNNGKFTLGFFQPGSKSSNNTLNTYLGIWFHKVPKLTPVWSANGDNPVPSLALPELIISRDGNLVVLAQGTIMWSTQANITANDTIVVLLGSENLVLRSSSNSSDIFWQSFDYPTDTLLAGAKFGRNKVTGLNRRMVSRKNLIDQAPGVYCEELAVDAIDLLWKSSVVYWSSGEWNGRFFISIPEMSAQSGSRCNYTFVNNDQEVYFSYNLLNENMIFHNFLDVSGQIQTRVWSDLAVDWITARTQPNDPCDVYATCGPFTICTDNGKSFCNCMKGFSIRSSEDWELEDRTGGCIRNNPLNCSGDDKNKTGVTDKFYSMPSIRLPQNAKGIQNASSANECARVCLNSCSCTAYSYGIGGCSIWHGELLNVVADDNGEPLHLRLAAKEVQSWKSNKRVIITGVAIGASIAAMGFLILIVIWRRIREWSSHAMDNDQSGIGIIAFKYVDMKRATKNFSEKLGGGGFGSVFKGCLSNSVAIAVKRLECAHQGEKQFRAEVNSIGII
ncbi:G-type lectin S-receptor-like serine/threonine-protein kinase At2g19130 [Phragmites australis]|uniref:G-type lectin S-receptor-like serine/threonine-protein kinase At2g19130 n=1 Tax=Phragmites australis TaxID=29695 RepID=UPI002D770EDA|nr:G-type lectin S-receptor-like serine/threonine-protein kinase At2g19130 [Phragmites australis]